MFLYRSAELSLRLWQESDPKESLHLANVYVMAAFALEGYVNDACARVVDSEFWNRCERKLNTEDKLRLLASVRRLNIDYSRHPWQSLREIFRDRDLFAHAKRHETSAIAKTAEGEPMVDTTQRGPIERLLFDVERARHHLEIVFDLVGRIESAVIGESLETHPLHHEPRSTRIVVRGKTFMGDLTL